MYFDRHFKRPSDNPLRVILYAVTAVLVVMTVLLTASAAQWNGRDDTQNVDRSATAGSRWPGGTRDATSNVYSSRSSDNFSNSRDTCGCQNNAGRMSGPV